MLTSKLFNAINNNQRGSVRLRSAAMMVHMLGTLLVAGLTFALIRLLWYPAFYWKIAGGAELFFLICAVDAVLGPVLTFSIFNPAKGIRRLRFDLIVIVTLQLIALLYGLWTVASVRPLYLVYSVDRFNLVTAYELSAKDLQSAELPQYKAVSWTGPRVIGTREPRNGDERFEFVDSALSGRDRHLLPKTYVPFEQVASTLIEHARALDTLKQATAKHTDLVAAAQKRFETAHPKLGFVPVIGQGDWVMVVDRVTGEQLDVLPIDGL